MVCISCLKYVDAFSNYRWVSTYYISIVNTVIPYTYSVFHNYVYFQDLLSLYKYVKPQLCHNINVHFVCILADIVFHNYEIESICEFYYHCKCMYVKPQ